MKDNIVTGYSNHGSFKLGHVILILGFPEKPENQVNISVKKHLLHPFICKSFAFLFTILSLVADLNCHRMHDRVFNCCLNFLQMFPFHMETWSGTMLDSFGQFPFL